MTDPKRSRTPKRELEEAAQAAEAPEAQQTNAVLVTREFGPNGGFKVDVLTLGDVRVTEVETILKHGIALIDSRLKV